MKKLIIILLCFCAEAAHCQSTSEEYAIEMAGRNYQSGKEWMEDNLKDRGSFAIHKRNGMPERITVSFIQGSYSFQQDYTIKKCYPAENSPDFTLCEVDCLIGIIPRSIQIGIMKLSEPNKLVMMETDNPYRDYTPAFRGVRK